jgi:hypothetical protein
MGGGRAPTAARDPALIIIGNLQRRSRPGLGVFALTWWSAGLAALGAAAGLPRVGHRREPASACLMAGTAVTGAPEENDRTMRRTPGQNDETPRVSAGHAGRVWTTLLRTYTAAASACADRRTATAGLEF